MKNRTRKTVLMGIMVSAALILGIIESLLPMPSVMPGAKLGLANIITMLAIMLMTPSEALAILLVRILLGSIFIGGFSSFLYSLGGGVVSYLAMLLVKRLLDGRIGPVGISVTGAYFHSVGQVTVAAVMISNWRIVSYLPVILAASIAAGMFIGFLSQGLLVHGTIRKLFEIDR